MSKSCHPAQKSHINFCVFDSAWEAADAFEHADLKRLPVYGEARSRALIGFGDVWLNLTTLARLFRQATAATGC
jgi:hypothetical protein